ncbi:hypothetical protein HID58_022669 [Brassica napus]|uniref:Uncharacterized protein n=1 Tax=Brassica napus TaxID=3708 RepID=A0ABQ8CZW7_BRANA|nr:hypothetical protein HID58_022669 [Brassica napus]
MDIQKAYEAPTIDYVHLQMLKAQLQLQYRMEEEYWRTKSRILWLQAGDKNTKQAVATRCCTTGRARSVSFIVFTDPCVAERVTMEKHTIDGRTVEAKKAVPRDDLVWIRLFEFQ